MGKTRLWIQDIDMNEGAFTKKARAAGMTVKQFEKKVLAKKSKYSQKTKRQARLSKTFRSFR